MLGHEKQEASMVSSGLVVDSVYVISDLHLGGVAPRQMFGETAALAGFIDGLPAGRCALVINGDFVDFLAEPPSRPMRLRAS